MTMVITGEILQCAGVLNFDCDPLPRWEGSLMYTSYVKQIKLGSHSQFEHLNSHIDNSWAELPSLNRDRDDSNHISQSAPYCRQGRVAPEG